MRIRTRLCLAFGVLAVFVLLVALLSLHSLGQANEDLAHYVEGVNARATLAAEVRNAVDKRAIAARNLLLVTRPADIATEKASVESAQADVVEKLARLQRMARAEDVSPQARQLIAEIADVEQRYAPVALRIVELALKGETAQGTTMMIEQCRPLLDALDKASDEYRRQTETNAQRRVEEANEQYSTQRNELIVLCSLAFVAAVISGWLIARGLYRDLGAEPGELSAAARKVANGDLGPVVGAAAATAGSVLASLGSMQESLALIVAQVRQSSDSIATGSTEIATGNADLSQRTEQQASALQQTAATMEELGSTVRQNAQHAEQANQLGQGASDLAVRGGEVVGEVVQTMRGIQQSSRKIEEIIAVIDGIAFQTNILALNAAVEAARAGAQGRGFAVVAGEVRVLAQRSAAAAQEIKGLITDSVDQVAKGSSLADRAGHAMGEIVAAIRKVSQIVGEINMASAEQSSGVDQVGQAVAQMDRATQQNAALVEQSAAAAESLRHQADSLVQTVAVFRMAVA
ncbi:methyl-accepting chemotaxis protein [Pelomonas sp. CA6]|uniref:methyl-accepting chemotaxis protein n=1 Tax=Pelomonas sp. CA6 TaxID=2907999 RepID=UPI001F4BD988|nr:methyl-accepting chemotaxis protein [Pelomonas sp. CA6]MCH7345122.1 methyl-accepting chemotaxis protein [Pelomonas sp. CA6]